MELFQKIKQIYPEIENECFYDIIRLVKPGDREAFIEKWEQILLTSSIIPIGIESYLEYKSVKNLKKAAELINATKK
jgi:hypothetical protein